MTKKIIALPAQYSGAAQPEKIIDALNVAASGDTAAKTMATNLGHQLSDDHRLALHAQVEELLRQHADDPGGNTFVRRA